MRLGLGDVLALGRVAQSLVALDLVPPHVGASENHGRYKGENYKRKQQHFHLASDSVATVVRKVGLMLFASK